MNARTLHPTRRLAASVMAAMILGWLGGAVAWALASAWRDAGAYRATDGRLDQLTALAVGGFVVAFVLGGRARHRREHVMAATLAGGVLGGAGALTGATLGMWLVQQLSWTNSPTAFVLARVVTWAWLASGASVGGTLWIALARQRLALPATVESAVLGALAGATAGALVSLPGATEFWWPAAMIWCGTGIGFAVVGTESWRAAAVVHRLPSRHGAHSLWSLEEYALDDGDRAYVDDAIVACDASRLTVYPPPAGATLDGYPLYQPLALTHHALVQVGRTRARITPGARLLGMLLMLLVTMAGAPRVMAAQGQGAHALRTGEAMLELVRCGPRLETPCLRTQVALPASGTFGDGTWSAVLGGVTLLGSAQLPVSGAALPTVRPVFTAPLVGGSTLGRTVLTGVLVLSLGDRPPVRLAARWRPPLIAAPMFKGTADSLAVSPAVRDALMTGAEPAGVRGWIGATVLLIGILLAVFVPRLQWRADEQSDEDLAQQVAAARTLLSTQEIAQLRGHAPRERAARRPEDETQQAAILRRPST